MSIFEQFSFICQVQCKKPNKSIVFLTIENVIKKQQQEKKYLKSDIIKVGFYKNDILSKINIQSEYLIITTIKKVKQ